MSKTWYPAINYELCIECGACFNKCSHGTFTMEESRPVVSKPEGCVQGCHGCGNLCPVGAIEYIGDNTGWTPPGMQRRVEESCCGTDSKKNTGCCDSSSGCCG